jgi:pyruvate/oxaloacetate carboxyltransferase
MRNIEHHFPAAQKLGMKVAGIVCFSESPVHTDEYFAARTQDLLDAGVDAVLLYDASGVMTPERTRTLVPTLQRVIGERAGFELTAHCATGLGAECLAEGLRLGVRRIFTAGRPLAYADSIPATLDMVGLATALGLDVRLDLDRVREADDYFTWIACAQSKRVPRAVVYDPEGYRRYASHQIPGGMMSNMVRQLTDLGLQHRFPEILEEAAQVRREIGYPVMVTPLSQLVGVQATLNVVEGERYRTIPQELRMYARGYYGRPASPIDPNVLDRILQAGDIPIDPSANFAEPYLDRFRVEEGPFSSDEEMLLAVFNSRETLEEFQREKRPIDGMPALRTPLRSLLAELGRRRAVRSMSIRTPALLSYGDAADVLASVDACPAGYRYDMQRGPLELTIEKKAQGNGHGH